MLNSNTDRNIKRLLSTVGILYKRSKIYNSIYYKITYPDGTEILVRFSDHFSNKKNYGLNIIKTTLNLYTIKDDHTKICTTLEAKDIVGYLRKLIIVLPDIINVINNLIKANSKLENNYNKLKIKILNIENKRLGCEIKDKNLEINQLRKNYNSYKSDSKKYRLLINKIEALK